MANPTDSAAVVVNQALDAIGANTISEMRDGSREANAAVRHYGPRIRDMLRAANWNFARKDARLSLAKDRTNTDGTLPTDVPQPWVYEYLYPQDCVKVRFVPQCGAVTDIEEPPIMTNLGGFSPVWGEYPAPFVIGNDLAPGSQDVGLGVILTNVKDARLIYTAAVMNPQLWDALFLTGSVALLAAWLALPCLDDKKMALEMRAQQIAIARDAVGQARVANGNESWSTADNLPDWIRVRGYGGLSYAPWGPIGAGNFFGWQSLYFPDGSAY